MIPRAQVVLTLTQRARLRAHRTWLQAQIVCAALALMLAMAVLAALTVVAFGCSLNHDYRDPLVGGQGVAAVEQCKQDRYQPCGWVYAFPNVERDNPLGVLELCILWPDRIGPYPYKLLETAESLYGDSEMSPHERFAGTPICRYVCPSIQGCNAYNGCYCLDDM